MKAKIDPSTLQVGHRYQDMELSTWQGTPCIYILACLEMNQYALINLDSGNRYADIASTMEGAFNGDLNVFIKVD